MVSSLVFGSGADWVGTGRGDGAAPGSEDSSPVTGPLRPGGVCVSRVLWKVSGSGSAAGSAPGFRSAGALGGVPVAGPGASDRADSVSSVPVSPSP
ncbi:hypothetical protein, partial [Nocardiopsis dassonvillei]